MDSAHHTITITCHCNAAKQVLTPRNTQDVFSNLSLCHCDSCRHSTGLLCTSYTPISSPPSTTGLESYSVSPASTRYFCSTCGCHIFRTRHPSPTAPSEEWKWEVATGTIIDAPAPSRLPETSHHQHTNATNDGGLSHWLQALQPSHDTNSPPPPDENNNDTLRASCHCTSITLLITRASPSPLNPNSPYPDLLLPYTATPLPTILNASHEKWYLRPTNTSIHTNTEANSSSILSPPQANNAHAHIPYRYLAGTCACQPCRLTSGFEIQTWAFIPRRNIAIRGSSSSSSSVPAAPSPLFPPPSPPPSGLNHATYQPLDFSHLPAGVPLKEYDSSPGRAREFCAVCGATVFWHDTFRPDLIDVSAGLFRAEEGARAEHWLEWWTERVSFSEEAGKGRAGGAKVWGEEVIAALEGGMRGPHRQG
ncbi:hypothetical protein F5144DRAFT_323792 [Chaetomium tenue]|uniref:Uncharacterized protein n=1 Tax=Chaetomium tenue TaxID=1854479 RepID=A0ACB7P6B0_9PEZI|nr:hypothetical protein F5144DRAFT_323792 [Chaetomium globosum]